jgi:hypothetical protein
MQFTDHHPSKLACSIKQACLVSSLGRTTIYNHIAENRHRAVRVGGTGRKAMQEAMKS